MPRAILLLLIAGVAGCYGPYDEGFDDGCYEGSLDGAMWGGVDAALCYRANPLPGAVIVGSSRYDEGYLNGYESCFSDAYLDAYDVALVSLEYDLGPCEELL